MKGIIEKLKKSGRYELIDKEKDELNKLNNELIKEKAMIDVAKKMKKDNIDIDTIKKYTKLSKWEIKKL